MVLLGEHSMYIFKVSIRAKQSHILQMTVSYHMRHVYHGVPPAHEEYEYSTCILSTSKGEATADFTMKVSYIICIICARGHVGSSPSSLKTN